MPSQVHADTKEHAELLLGESARACGDDEYCFVRPHARGGGDPETFYLSLPLHIWFSPSRSDASDTFFLSSHMFKATNGMILWDTRNAVQN